MTQSKWICSLPWTGFSNDPNGIARPCCIFKGNISDENGNPFYVQTTSVKDILHSKYMVDLRQQFLDGEKPQGCITCITDEGNGLTSKRMRYLRFGQQHTGLMENAETDAMPLEYQMIISNACNLKCRSCTPSHSSTWQGEHLEVYGHTGYDMPHGQAGTDDSMLWETRHEWMPHVERLEVVGGEPFYIGKWKEYWEEMIEHGYSKTTILNLSTNCTIIDEELVEKLSDNFKRVGFGLSIDGMGAIYNYLRHPGDWNVSSSNILKYYELSKRLGEENFSIEISHTIGWVNAFYLPEFHDWVNENAAGTNIWNNVIHFPIHMSIYNIPKQLKEIIADKWSYHDWGHYKNDIDGIRDFMMSKQPTDDEIHESYKMFTKFDEHRGESLPDTIPEIYDHVSRYFT